MYNRMLLKNITFVWGIFGVAVMLLPDMLEWLIKEDVSEGMFKQKKENNTFCFLYFIYTLPVLPFK